MRRTAIVALCFGLLAGPVAGFAQQPENIALNEKDTRQLTPHVWAIYGNPNIGIVAGSQGTLVAVMTVFDPTRTWAKLVG